MRTEPSFSAKSDGLVSLNVDGSDSGLSIDSDVLQDYRQRYGLSVDPFEDDPHFPFYTGAQRRQILDQILHLCRFSHHLLLVTGDYGVGKTRMAQALIDSLADEDDICFLEGQVTSTFTSVLRDICTQFELADAEDFSSFCQKQGEPDGLAVLIVDNAHHLSDAVLFDIISLLGGSASRLHIVLFGESHVHPRLESISTQSVVISDFHLEKFTISEASDYLNFRMEMADYLGPEIFTEAKIESWWRYSQGQLVSLHEYAQEKLLETVTAPTVNQGKRVLPVPHIIGVAVLLSLLSLGYLYFGGGDKKPSVNRDITKVAMTSVPAHDISNSVASSTVVNSSSIFSSGTSGSVGERDLGVSVQGPINTASSSLSSTSAIVKQIVVPLLQANTGNLDASKSAHAISKVSASKPTAVISEVPAKNKFESSAPTKSHSIPGVSEQEAAILSWDANQYTLQLVGVSMEKAAREFIAAQSNRKELFLFRTIRQGKDWFVVITGQYVSNQKARQAVQQLPESQQKSTPWPRDLKTIQSEIKHR